MGYMGILLSKALNPEPQTLNPTLQSIQGGDYRVGFGTGFRLRASDMKCRSVWGLASRMENHSALLCG